MCLNQITVIDHLFPSNLLPDDHIISYGVKSAVGAFRKLCPGALTSAFGAKADVVNSMIGAERTATACSPIERL